MVADVANLSEVTSDEPKETKIDNLRFIKRRIRTVSAKLGEKNMQNVAPITWMTH
jgi:hypothetical protein